MTRDEVIRLAREAGSASIDPLGLGGIAVDWLSRFAELVTIAEREACAADCDAAADRLAACPASPENRAAISALRHRAQAIRARGSAGPTVPNNTGIHEDDVS